MSESVADPIDGLSNQASAGVTRRNVVSGFLAATGLAALGVLPSSAEAQEQRVAGPRLVEMPDHNMPEGFKRSKIIAEVRGETEVIGSVFFMEDERAKAEFITRTQNPEAFSADGHPNFDQIQSDVSARGDKVLMVAAGAFFTNAGQTQGIALQDGRMVGEAQAASELNGILVIRNGVPSIEYLNQLPDPQAFFEQAKREGWSLFQQTSYLRPGGQFQSSNPSSYELRFFVEGGGKKAVINFSEKMTYAEAVLALEQLAGFKIEKAIGLDAGAVSEARFFDKDGKAYPMLDEQFGRGKGYTNVLVLYSDL